MVVRHRGCGQFLVFSLFDLVYQQSGVLHLFADDSEDFDIPFNVPASTDHDREIGLIDDPLYQCCSIIRGSILLERVYAHQTDTDYVRAQFLPHGSPFNRIIASSGEHLFGDLRVIGDIIPHLSCDHRPELIRILEGEEGHAFSTACDVVPFTEGDLYRLSVVFLAYIRDLCHPKITFITTDPW